MRELKKRITIIFFIRILIGTYLVLISLVSQADQIETATRFRLHIVEDPGRILPQFQSRSSSQYLVGNLFDSYFRLDGNAELQSSMMKSCVWKTNTRLLCTPQKRYWANKEEIRPKDYYDHLKRQLQKESLSSAKEIFSELLNYSDYLKGKVPFSKVGLKLKNGKIEFRIRKADRDFLYSLTHPVLSPIPDTKESDELIAQKYATGPYKLKEWKRGRSLILERNPQHPVKIDDAPLVEFFIIAEYYTALNFYEKGNLDFLRRFPLENLARFQKTPQLISQTLHRFDYIGFGPELRKDKELSHKVQTSYDGAEFQKLMSSPGKVGCVSISDKLQSKTNCLEFNITNKKVSDSHRRLKLHFAKQAGENVARGMQWFQAQWKKNLNLKISLVSEDWKYLESQLTRNAPDLFRKGVPLLRPTCLAALEVFESKSKDNYIQFSNKKYDQIVSRMRMPKTPKSQLPSLCSRGIDLLLKSRSLIPLGEMTFYMLSNGRFKGFTINKLNQLDLTRLSAL